MAKEIENTSSSNTRRNLTPSAKSLDGIEERLASRVHSHLRPILDPQTIESVQVTSDMLKNHGPGNFIHNRALYEFFFNPRDERLVYHSLEELGFGEKDESFDESFTKIYNKVTTCFPLSLSETDIHRIGKFFCYGRIVDAYSSQRNLTHPLPGFLLGDANPNDLEAEILRLSQLKQMVRSLDEEMFAAIYVQWKFGASPIDIRKQTLPLLFAVAIERFLRSSSKHHFVELLEIYKVFVEHTPRGETVARELKPNRIHPCFHVETPAEGVNFFMKFAIMKMVVRDRTMLHNSDLGQLDFIENNTLKQGRFARIHPRGFDILWKKFQSLRRETIRLGLMKNGSAGVREVDNTTKELQKLLTPMMDFVLSNQRKIRGLIGDQALADLSRKEQKSLLQSYGDLGTPNPIRPQKSLKYRIDNFSLKDPKEFLNNPQISAVEVVDILSETQDDSVTVQNRLCLLYTSPSPRDLSTSRMPSSA